ncbi:MAG: type II toxin-antitoxin system HicA family toxin [Candidatus Micrarchaeota archaeon]|nr:type II toxin-antitoxin system HicA family toxin [Candidatus Micrarchaeota archaeon]
MARLVVKDSKLLKVLMKNFRFTALRQRGSHIRLTDGIHKVTIAIHNRELKEGTLHSILEQAGLTKKDIEDKL